MFITSGGPWGAPRGYTTRVKGPKMAKMAKIESFKEKNSQIIEKVRKTLLFLAGSIVRLWILATMSIWGPSDDFEQ